MIMAGRTGVSSSPDRTQAGPPERGAKHRIVGCVKLPEGEFEAERAEF
jgi:hypothetical protein